MDPPRQALEGCVLRLSPSTSETGYLYPWGWGELEGIANRTDYDLKKHAEYSGAKISYFDPEAQKRFVPYVIEPAAGATCGLLVYLVDAYCKRHRRHDEIGTPWCLTIDGQTLEDGTLTIRDRDTMQQRD